MKTNILIIGGGLSGLHTAYTLHQRGVDVTLVEARDRLGGRILSQTSEHSSDAAFDLGPTWFWPGQRRIETLVQTLGLELEVFEQPSSGEALYENETGKVLRGLDGVSMAGSFRLEGGIARIIHSLADRIPKDTVQCRSRATRIEQHNNGLRTTLLRDGHDTIIDSGRVVIALPPRLAVDSIVFSPELPPANSEALRRTPTWMAGHAKLVALYDEPFWRHDGLSGDAISYRGPLGEIHDASPQTGGPAALFGFVGVPPSTRENRDGALKEAAISQLEKLFGHRAAQPREVLIKDWAFDPLTATPADHEPQVAHSVLWPGESPEISWDQCLLWSGSETADDGLRNNGYLEGALEASERTVRQLEVDLKHKVPS